ncbi:hypothetical protein FB451DRAFT_1196039 [Mycena latifolia]|nr:hypothetical protein FB451DRAFT_1196039 [Mycena latifolia]
MDAPQEGRAYEGAKRREMKAGRKAMLLSRRRRGDAGGRWGRQAGSTVRGCWGRGRDKGRSKRLGTTRTGPEHVESLGRAWVVKNGIWVPLWGYVFPCEGGSTASKLVRWLGRWMERFFGGAWDFRREADLESGATSLDGAKRRRRWAKQRLRATPKRNPAPLHAASDAAHRRWKRPEVGSDPRVIERAFRGIEKRQATGDEGGKEEAMQEGATMRIRTREGNEGAEGKTRRAKPS